VTDYPREVTDATQSVLSVLQKLPWMRALDSQHVRTTAFDAAYAAVEAAAPGIRAAERDRIRAGLTEKFKTMLVQPGNGYLFAAILDVLGPASEQGMPDA
jgi:hypothetical protein